MKIAIIPVLIDQTESFAVSPPIKNGLVYGFFPV